MRGVGVTLLLAGALGACGDNELRERCLDPDRPHPVQLRVYGAFELLAVRYGADQHDWLERREDGDYELCAADDVLVTLVCIETDGRRTIQQHGILSSEESDLDVYGCFGRSSVEGLVVVRLEVAQGGYATIGATSQGLSGTPWTADYYVREGEYELIATTAFSSGEPEPDPRLVRRPIEARAPLTLVAVDIDAEGESMPSLTLEVAGLAPDERLESTAILHTARSFARIAGSRTLELSVAPAHLVRMDEHQDLALTARSSVEPRSYSRAAHLEYRGGDSVAVELLPRLEALTLLGTPAGPGVRRAELPAATTRVRISTSDASAFQQATFTRGWLERRGGDLVTFDVDVTGFDPAWIVPAEDGFVRVEVDRGDVLLESVVNAPLVR